MALSCVIIITMKSILLLLTVCLLPIQADEKAPEPAKKPDEVRKLLSQHVTIAEFEGLEFRACRHLTSLCPNKCTHAGQVATFKITKYLDYKKPGQYGDPKREKFRLMIEDQLGNAKVPDDIRIAIKALQKGDAVHLSWNHDYVTKNRSSYPERSITKLAKVVAKGE